jgi:hypothetical protein
MPMGTNKEKFQDSGVVWFREKAIEYWYGTLFSLQQGVKSAAGKPHLQKVLKIPSS